MMRFNLAKALRSTGDYAGAKAQEDAIIAFYDDLIRRDPGNADHHYFKANALAAMQELEPAVEEYKQALRIDPHYPRAQETIDGILKKLSGSR
jgi:tetratricopeptide (TPR) repeat protein